MMNAKAAVMPAQGGIQEEATFLGSRRGDVEETT